MTRRGDRPVSDRPPRRRGGLYVHIPFCDSTCAYCHFARTADHGAPLRRRVAAALVAEFELRRAACPGLDGAEAATAYVGGGTPSVLEPELMAAVLAGTLGRLSPAKDAEITAEANPESFVPVLADAWRAAGINRVSLGVQSLDPALLELLGRRGGPAASRRALALAAARFARVSADWILAPGCDPRRLAAEFAEARDLGVGHVSFYILEVHAGTRLADRIAAGRTPAPDDAEVERTYLAAAEELAGLGYRQYEISNFALPGQESRHNSAYWRREPYLGLGPGAHGFWGRRRYANQPDPRRWCAAVEAGRIPEAEVDLLDRRARRLEAVILPLRTTAGAPLDLLPSSLDLAPGEREGLWRTGDGRLRLTPRGMLRLDDVEAWLAAAL